MYEVRIETNFSSAHHLLNYKGKCENMHGHNWKVEVLKKKVNEIIDYLDHKDLNELPEFKGVSPSSEIIAKYIFDEVKKEFENVSKVSVYETPTSCATYSL